MYYKDLEQKYLIIILRNIQAQVDWKGNPLLQSEPTETAIYGSRAHVKRAFLFWSMCYAETFYRPKKVTDKVDAP